MLFFSVAMRKYIFKHLIFIITIATIILMIYNLTVKQVQNIETTTQVFKVEKQQHTSNSQKLLTLFTTFKNSQEKYFIYLNVLRNWILLSNVTQVLFIEDAPGNLAELAKKLGWNVHIIPRVNEFGTPYLKEMFQFVYEKYNSTYYGFCNGDILFEDGLTKTLKAVSNLTKKERINKTVMIVGKRTNFRIKTDQSLYKSKDIKKLKGEIFNNNALDYFLISGTNFPWHKVADIVIGRPAYDNYLVALATSKLQVQLVDATLTILALHQTDRDGNDHNLYHGLKNKDQKHNINIIGDFNFEYGTTNTADLRTSPGSKNTVDVLKNTHK